MGPECSQSARLILPNETAVANHVSYKNGGKSALDVLGHG
jgi:hypothetical protein